MAIGSGGHTRRTTMGDVAARAGVDVSVVSRVLSGDPDLRVRDETRDDVLRYVRELKYRPNMLAKGLRTSRSQMVGLILPDFRNPIYASIIVGAERAAAELDLVLLVGTTAKGELAEERQNSILSSGRLDALLVAGAMEGMDLTPLMSTGVPTLLVNRRSAGIDRFVIVDNARAASIAVKHLASLGHRRIGHIAGYKEIEPSRRRQAGYLAAMREADLQTKASWVVRSALTAEGGAEAMGRILELPDRPTAIVTDSVAPALGALEEARRQGVIVPDDLSIVGVNDIDLLNWIHPGLTTVHTPLEELGALAIRTVCAEDADSPIGISIGEPMELIVRESTAPPPA